MPNSLTAGYYNFQHSVGGQKLKKTLSEAARLLDSWEYARSGTNQAGKENKS